jgi:hypothetical protein
MFYPLAVVFLLLTVALLLAGTIGQKYTALYVLKCVWLPGFLLAVYLTLGAWRERSYSENWAAFGVLFFVLPFTGLVLLQGIAEFVLLRGRHDQHAKTARIATAVVVGLLLICSLVGLLSA